MSGENVEMGDMDGDYNYENKGEDGDDGSTRDGVSDGEYIDKQDRYLN